MNSRRAFLILLLCIATCSSGWAQSGSKPKVRAITAFVHIDRSHYQEQIQDALKVLRSAKAAYEKEGYEVETIRITTQPFPDYVRGMTEDEALALFKALDDLSVKEKFLPNVGPAMLADNDDHNNVNILQKALSTLPNIEGSIIVAGEDGVHWKAVSATAALVKYVAEHSPHSQGTFNFTATAMLAPYGPFFPGSYHLGSGHQFSVGLESANVVDEVFASVTRERGAVDKHFSSPEDATQQALKPLIEALSKHAVACEAIAKKVAEASGWSYAGLDPTPAPLAKVSIGAAIEKLTGRKFGSSGTLTAAAVITRAVQAVPVKRVGYSGLMVPVMEDSTLAQRWAENAINIDSLLAYSAVCGTGLDTIPLPGDVTEEQMARIIGDMASLAFKWKKPLSARLQPVTGKKAGEKTEFDDPFLTNTLIQKLP